MSDDQRRAECAHRRRGPQPAEPDRSDVQNLVGKNRQQRRRAPSSTANISSVIVARITFLLKTKRIPATTLCHGLSLL